MLLAFNTIITEKYKTGFDKRTHLDAFPKDKEFYKNELENQIQIKQNFLIFNNFIISTNFGG